MKKTFSFALSASTIVAASLCFSCGKNYKIEFEYIHCTGEAPTTINTSKEYLTSFKIENGYELLINNIEVNNNGNIDNNCWTFSYQSNLVNTFKIKPNFVRGDVKVKVNCTAKHIYKYGCAVDVSEVDQSSITFTPIQKKIEHISDWQRDAYPVDEDEELNFTFKAISGKTLPTNIGMWMNGRYAKEGVEVTFTYSNNNTECKVHVPPYVARDNLQFRCK